MNEKRHIEKAAKSLAGKKPEVQITIRISKAQHRLLCDAAKKANTNVSEIIRAVLFARPEAE